MIHAPGLKKRGLYRPEERFSAIGLMDFLKLKDSALAWNADGAASMGPAKFLLNKRSGLISKL